MGKYFGTDGVRGVANSLLNSNMAYRIGRLLGQYPNGKKNKILIGRDTRLSGSMLDCALCSGITSSGSDVYELAITTTPSISYLVQKGDYDFGIMISASHNPYYDNGIKIFAPNGEKINEDLEALIEDYIDGKDYLPFAVNEKLGRLIVSKNLVEDYLCYLASKKSVSYEGLKVLIDCANGSASVLAKELFAHKLGLKADFINKDYDGLNINNHCGSTHVKGLIEKVKDGQYDLGLAFDGDSDRLIAVSSSGRVVDGDALIYLSSLYLKKRNRLSSNKVVITVMSNIGLKKALQKEGIDFLVTSVGDKYVQKEIKDKSLSLGGEQSGHIIYGEYLNTGDGMLSAIMLLNILAEEKKPLDELLKDLKAYPQLLVNIVVANKDAVLADEGLQALVREADEELGDEGRLLVRASGTEQLVRVMVEAPTNEKCRQITDKLIDYIQAIAY